MASKNLEDVSFIQFEIPFKDSPEFIEMTKNINKIQGETRTKIKIQQIVHIVGSEDDVEEARRRVSRINIAPESTKNNLGQNEKQNLNKMHQILKDIQNKILVLERKKDQTTQVANEQFQELLQEMKGIQYNINRSEKKISDLVEESKTGQVNEKYFTDLVQSEITNELLVNIHNTTSDIDSKTKNIQAQLAKMTRDSHDNGKDLMDYVNLDTFYKSSEYINCEKDAGQLALHTACMLGRVDIVKKLIQNGKSIIAENKTLGWTPLHYACYHGHLNVVKFLIDMNAPINWKSHKGTTPLIQASWHGRNSIVEFLCSKGADVSIKNENNITAMSAAIENNKYGVIKILRKYGA